MVHFSFLLEYMAYRIGVPLGSYHQITNNLHIYPEMNWKPDNWNFEELMEFTPVPFDATDTEIQLIADNDLTYTYESAFLRTVAVPMLLAYDLYTEGKMADAMEVVNGLPAADWRVAAMTWLGRKLATC